jgi:proteasome lid subunit RPN8/RPN11
VRHSPLDIPRTIVALRLSADQIQAMQTHADRTYPDECCGLLLGTVQAGDRVVVEVRSVENAWNPEVASALAEPEIGTEAEIGTEVKTSSQTPLSLARRYWIAPEVMLAAMRQARRRSLEIIGIYHSHPDHPAVPSECDRRLAWPQYSYVILSVPNGHSQDCQSWILDDRQQFQPEPICLVVPAASAFP